MALVLRGNEFVATEALSASVLTSLVALAARRPLVINGLRMCAQELMGLAEEARRSMQPVWVGEPEGRARGAE